MAYHSIKRVLGETSLERKCRLLFGICLLLMIALAFGFVEYKAENMVLENTRQKGRDLVSMILMKFHFRVWETSPDMKELLERTIASLDHPAYSSELLSLEPSANAHPPRDRWEQQTLERFRTELLQRMRAGQLQAKPEKPVDPFTQPPPNLAAEDRPAAIFEERFLPEKNEYHYLEPVVFTKNRNCSYCHLEPMGHLPAIDGHSQDSLKFRVVKVVLPYGEVQAATNTTRATLIAVAIITVFMAMIFLYVITHFVIVKPLKHLRDVSDEISRGNNNVRAELTTNDEFEELATSFNRMVRHLVETQANLREVNRDLDAKIDELAQANLRLYEMNRLKGDFLANMSHELRTPLNSIIGFSDVLQGLDSLTDQQKRYARNIQQSGRLLLDMINDILDLAKMEAGKMELRPTEFRIDSLIHAQCDLVRSLTDEKNIDLKVQIDPSLPSLFQDQGKIQQILTNLLSNAIKFTPEGGRIRVTARATGHDQMEIDVSDTGVGIAEEDLDVIFEKFRQGSTKGGDRLTREYSGTGLGLSIVRELCILLGGRIEVASEIGVGSAFKVTLPFSCPHHMESRISSKLQELEGQTAVSHLLPRLHGGTTRPVSEASGTPTP